MDVTVVTSPNAAFITAAVIAWLIAAVSAAMIAEARGRSATAFFVITLAFLGPLGPGFALIAQREIDSVPVGPAGAPARPVAAGRRRFTCPRCGAANDVPNPDAAYDCWRCDEHRTVAPV